MGITVRKRRLKSGRMAKRYEAIVYCNGVVRAQKTFETYSAAERFHREAKEKLSLTNGHSPTPCHDCH